MVITPDQEEISGPCPNIGQIERPDELDISALDDLRGWSNLRRIGLRHSGQSCENVEDKPAYIKKFTGDIGLLQRLAHIESISDNHQTCAGNEEK